VAANCLDARLDGVLRGKAGALGAHAVRGQGPVQSSNGWWEDAQARHGADVADHLVALSQRRGKRSPISQALNPGDFIGVVAFGVASVADHHLPTTAGGEQSELPLAGPALKESQHSPWIIAG
jgi:hypothetical protein